MCPLPYPLPLKYIESFGKDIVSTIMISDNEVDKGGKPIKQPVLVFSAEGERISYIPVSELLRWLDNQLPSEEISTLTKVTNKEEEFVVEDYGREYLIARGGPDEHVRYSAWRVSIPNVRGYGKTPNDAIYDLIHNVQPL